MDYWVLLLLILAVTLSSCGAGAQSTIATISTTSDTITDTTNTDTASATTETDTIPTASYTTNTTVFPTPRPNAGSTSTTTDPTSAANTNAPTTITPPPSSPSSPSPVSALTTTAPTTVSTVSISNSNSLTSSPTATLLIDTAAPTPPTSITPTPISNTTITKATATTRPPLFTPPPTTFTTSTPRTPPTTPNLISNATTNINTTATIPSTVTSANFTTDIMTPSPPPSPSTTVTTYTSTVSPTTSPSTSTTPTAISSSTTTITTPTPLLTHTTTTFVSFSPATPVSTTTTTIINTTTTTNTTTTPTYTTTTTTTPTTSPAKTTISTTTATTATTTTPPPPSTTLKCENDGVPQQGICVCPDKWTGDTCSVENFCRALNYTEFHFPETLVGWFAYSVEFCQEGNAAGTPKASTRCSIKNGSPAFELPPNILQCDQTLNEIQQNLTSGADLEFLAANTQILTSVPEQLTTENITAAAQIANTLLLSPNATENVRVAAVATVSQLLNTNTPDDSKENSATLGLTLTLEQLSVNLSRLDGMSQSQVVQPNLVVHSAQIPAAYTQGVQFTSLPGVSGSFVAKRIQLKTNVSKVEVENGIKADAMMFVRFPPAGRQRSSNVSMGFVLYQNDRFFRSKLFKRERITFRVLSATILVQERSIVPQCVEMQFSPTVRRAAPAFK